MKSTNVKWVITWSAEREMCKWWAETTLHPFTFCTQLKWFYFRYWERVSCMVFIINKDMACSVWNQIIGTIVAIFRMLGYITSLQTIFTLFVVLKHNSKYWHWQVGWLRGIFTSVGKCWYMIYRIDITEQEGNKKQNNKPFKPTGLLYNWNDRQLLATCTKCG